MTEEAQNQPARRVRHKKRGAIYTILGTAELQSSCDIMEGAVLTVYLGEDGKWWARPRWEFEDGRFEDVSMSDPKSETAVTLAQIAPLALPKEQSFVATANRLLGWSIDSNGGAYLSEAGVDRVDRMVAALIRIRDGGAPAEFEAIARAALP